MRRHWVFALLGILALLATLALSACEQDEVADEATYEECAMVQTEPLCEACCNEKAAYDFVFDADGDRPCKCVPVP